MGEVAQRREANGVVVLLESDRIIGLCSAQVDGAPVVLHLLDDAPQAEVDAVDIVERVAEDGRSRFALERLRQLEGFVQGPTAASLPVEEAKAEVVGDVEEEQPEKRGQLVDQRFGIARHHAVFELAD